METNELNEETKVETPVAEELQPEPKKKLTISTKQIFILMAVAVLIITAVIVTVKVIKNKKIEAKVESLYNVMEDTSGILDIVADTIYCNWYDYIYEDEYYSIDEAVWMAFITEADNIDKIEANDVLIDNMFKEIKENNYKDKNEDVYYAMVDAYDSYKEYYEFVINVSGSFNSYSAQKETLKKEVKSYLNKFERSL